MSQSESAIRWENFLLTIKDSYPAMHADYTKRVFVVCDDKVPRRKRKK